MEKTWTVVRFEDENVVEAVPTSWITNGRCYWPPYTTEKTLKAIKDHVDFNSSWASYEVYIFKNSTSESYQACRLKAKKAEDTSDLNSDYNKKRIIKKNRLYESDSSESDNFNDMTLPSPPDLKEHSDTEIQISKKDFSRTKKVYTCVGENPQRKNTQKDIICDSFNNNNNNVSDICNIKRKSYNKENHRPIEMYTTNKEKNIGEKYYEESSTNNNVFESSNTNVHMYTSNIQQKYSQKDVNMHKYASTDKQIGNAICSTSADKQTDNANLCTCCPTHKNYDEKFRRVFKELFFLREVTKECCEDMKTTFLRKEDTNTIHTNEPTFLNKFNFPLRRLEELNEVEEYLQEPNHFQSTVRELSKMGGATPYDFVKRCLSILFSNRFAEQYSWHGAKKKQIFGKLFLANVLQESALLCKAAENRKEVEEAIKAWLRRAKERANKEEKSDSSL